VGEVKRKFVSADLMYF